jgi:4-diphosphocytidyl-2-C-methyl-D-erythritol kinase
MNKHTYFAPAKLNRFLHIIGRREDGYHELQTIFQRINYGDTLEFTLRNDNEINFKIKMDPEILKPTPTNFTNEINIVVQAATLLRSFSNLENQGVDITLIKKIPIGAGLGGGSSDAASTLLALKQLWNINLPKEKLSEIGLSLGADVPFFILEQDAWGEGVGEKLIPIILPKAWFLVVVPKANISTVEIYTYPLLTRDTPALAQDISLIEKGHNDCEAVAKRLYPEVAEVIETLSRFTKARLTGSGSCVFVALETEQDALELVKKIPPEWRYFLAESLD